MQNAPFWLILINPCFPQRKDYFLYSMKLSATYRLQVVPIFPLEFVEPWKDIAKTGVRNPGQGKTREARKIGTAALAV